MTRIERAGEDFVVPAAMLARAFGLDEAQLKAAMREGALTSRCEAGTDRDAGTWRLTFRFRGRALRITVNGQGEILQRARFPVRPTRRPGPAGADPTDSRRA